MIVTWWRWATGATTHRTRRPSALAPVVAGLLLASACQSNTAPDSDRDAGPSRPTTTAFDPAAKGKAAKVAGCLPVDQGNETARFQRVETDDVGIDAVRYPVPDYPGRLWSQWGQGVVLPDGRYVSAVGDHCGIDGDSFVFEVDAATSTMRRVGGVGQHLDRRPGEWGYGKIHAPAVSLGGDGVYLATYWGSRRGIRYTDNYTGDALVRYDAATGKLTKVAVPVPGHGIPSLAGWPAGGLLYGEAVDGTAGEKSGAFFVFDTKSGRTIFRSDEPRHAGFRSILVDAEGRAYFSAGEGKLWRYDPDDDRLALHEASIPGAHLRAASAPAPDGTVYGVTDDPAMLFRMPPDGGIQTIGPVRGYTASIALDATGRRLFYVPDAHGKAWEEGTPLIAVDVDSGEESVVVKLNDTVGKKLDLTLGGSYNVAYDPRSKRVYVGLNGGTTTADTFGQVVLAVVTPP